jgi:alkanesulfonate monooxygenase SsuD/methylene tetrahydromethanopterin reductase-like flavin-dependent oxidoreductase (luciferase family)
MRFGVHLPNFGPFGDPQTLAALAAEAESSGWDGFFLWDHILADPQWREPMVDPWIALAAVASATREIRLGALVTAVPRRRPWHLARETTTLDHLSNGRLVVGVGLGFPPGAEFEHFGEDGDARRRARLLDEGLAILAGLWSGEPFAFDGDEYHIRETVFLPTPVQRPRPPIWVAAHSPNRAPLRRAARWDGVFPEHADGSRLSPMELAELLDYVRQHRAAPDPFDAVIAGRSADVGAEELGAYAAAGLTWWLESSRPNDLLADMRERIAAGPPNGAR